MRITIAFTSLLLLTLSFMHPAAAATGRARAHLQLLVVDQAQAPLARAAVTVYTLDGRPGVTVKTDTQGHAVWPDVATGTTQIVAKAAGYQTSIDKVTLHVGDNTRTVTLHVATGES